MSTDPIADAAQPLPDEQLRDRIAEALMQWAEGNHNPAYASLRRPETVTANARGRAEAVLAVVQPELDRLRAERDAARAQIAAVALVRVWRNEDGKEFLFADDVRAALGIATVPTTT